MNVRNAAGKPRVFGVCRAEQVERSGDFFEARNATRVGEKVVVSYDGGETWYDVGRSPVSKDDRKH